ncbi:hypothetical protein KPSA3_00863 [Pseudomonas syringae pv. actinidiae]|uniref:Uncharacterized protein n=1 Tax=Pseudomonas syringae pv. actinidiae TaxID=103796 RepID=A0AAN4Q0G3_PSESF|nr:hypothetical protein KPSA3_00863 [Pseudomonas syringae pv. actinidiae]
MRVSEAMIIATRDTINIASPRIIVEINPLTTNNARPAIIHFHRCVGRPIQSRRIRYSSHISYLKVLTSIDRCC